MSGIPRDVSKRLERDAGPGRLRAFRADDIPDLVALRRRAFRFGERETPEALAAYCEAVFCRNPWLDEELPSLVFEDESGRFAGFLGVIPRRMQFNGEPIRAAVATQLMVAPESRGLAGLRLARAFIDGPQDLSFSDTANDVARRLWRSVGGSVSVLHGLSWLVPLRPARHRATSADSSPLGRVARFAARPALAAIDATLARVPGKYRQRAPAGHLEPFDVPLVIGMLERELAGMALRPVYDAHALQWLVAMAAEKRQFGPLRAAVVRDRSGEMAGWFLYYGARGGVAQVLQVAARHSRESLVFSHLRHDAWLSGARALSGRCSVPFLSELEASGGVLRNTGPWVLYHTPRPAIALEIERGTAMLSRLEGEWWLSF